MRRKLRRCRAQRNRDAGGGNLPGKANHDAGQPASERGDDTGAGDLRDAIIIRIIQSQAGHIPAGPVRKDGDNAKLSLPADLGK